MFMLFGFFAGFILVPLNSRIQELSPRVHLGTILAANNFIQNIFMFVFLVLTTLFAYFGMNAEVLFYAMGFVGIYLSSILFKRYMNEIFWATMELFSLVRHKYVYYGLENIPQEKGVLLLSNHVSWLDWILLQLPLSRKINFMMNKEIYHWRMLHPLFKKGEAIAVSPRGFKDAFKEAHARLKANKVVGIFPEGGISKDGKLGEFHRGFELIEKDYDGVILPAYIGKGIFGSAFSKYKPQTRNWFKRRVVEVRFLSPVPKETTAQEIKKIIQQQKDQDEAQ
jgi:acyl-[acyl-carrier-protein]-phospholipid O-acyltransferase/long-chain-fatty-acid--[acyl-carrier-protein] ligase